jgi:hypothetical protein
VPQVDDRAQFPGRLLRQRGVPVQNRGGPPGREHQQAGDHLRASPVQGQVQPGHHAEVGACAPQRPEQARITGRLDNLAVGGDKFRAGEVVAGGPETAG